MISACVLIRTEKGKFEDVVEKLKNISGLRVAFPVLGRYDVVADIEASNAEELGKSVLRANRLAGIVFTETLPEVKTT